ncbi:hypothetical protein ULF88_22175 [Halopseudomonas pachastrellae]|nr:hypothetical protein [Halopseudomonas pachastrellae]
MAHVGIAILADHSRVYCRAWARSPAPRALNLFAGHHIDSLRRGQQVGSGFGRAQAAARHHAPDWGSGVCSYPFTRQQYAKHGAVSGSISRNNDIHTLPLLDGLQAGAAK